ncbi:MAG: HAMP domain-containing sensor histidine kinase [Polyangiaceae bacterium]
MTRKMQELAGRYVRYVVAIAACVVALVFQLLIWPYIPPSPQLLFYPAVLIAAWFGGLAPGVVAVMISSFAIAYWFLPPDTAFSQGDDLLDMAVFVAMGLTVAALMARTRASTSTARSAWREAETARVRLSQAYRAREELLAIVSHDLRTPLTSIELCSAQIIRSSTFPASDDNTRMAGERIQRATRRMEVLVQNLLDAATIDAGALRLQLDVVQVDALLESTVQLCQPIAERKSVRLEARPSGRTSLVCDGDRVRQTLENLVGNALNFVPQDGEVTLSVHTEEDQVVFEVRDTGPGIPPEQIGHVFDRYWRGGGGASSGLGLYIAKAIVEGHGGRIWVTSGEGRRGSVFAFTLPRARAERAAPLVALRSA